MLYTLGLGFAAFLAILAFGFVLPSLLGRIGTNALQRAFMGDLVLWLRGLAAMATIALSVIFCYGLGLYVQAIV